MPLRYRIRILSALLCCLAAPAIAQSTIDTQTSPNSTTDLKAPSTIQQLSFDGAAPWSQQDLQAASGLKPGMTITSDDLANAIARLSATGDFDDVQVVYYAPGTALNLILKLKPSDPGSRYAVRFANLPWWSSKDLIPLIHQTVPLFDGTLPQTGDQEDLVAAALQQLLLTKQITAKVTSEIAPPAVGQPNGSVVYRITTPEIRFSTVDIQGASPAMAPIVAKAAASLNGHAYSETALDDLLNSWHDAGYLNASLTDIHRDVSPLAAGHIDVHVTAHLTEGDLYHVSSVTFTPTGTQDSFAAAQRPDPTNLVIHQALRSSLTSITNAYRSLGFLDVRVDNVPKLDPATHTVAYTLSVIPGEQYHISTLKVEGLSPDQRQEFDSAWKLVPGAPFDATYTGTFLKSHPELHSLAGLSTRLATDADGDAHQVAIDVTFAKPRPRPTTNAKRPGSSSTPATKPEKTKSQPSKRPKSKAKQKTTPTQSSPAASK
jgi:outer membrane protein assembly factor BamA